MVRKKQICAFLLLVALAVIFLISGCAGVSPKPPCPEPLDHTGNGAAEGNVPGNNPAPETSFTLFFADAQAGKLVAEQREITGAGPDPGAAILDELIRGPEKPGLVGTIPPGVAVLGLVVDEKGLARADFSREIITAHWGGSLGEVLTVYSIVNTLARLPAIKQVQILVEGETVETLAGHLDISEPVDPDWDLVEK